MPEFFVPSCYVKWCASKKWIHGQFSNTWESKNSILLHFVLLSMNMSWVKVAISIIVPFDTFLFCLSSLSPPSFPFFSVSFSSFISQSFPSLEKLPIFFFLMVCPHSLAIIFHCWDPKTWWISNQEWLENKAWRKIPLFFPLA